MTVCPWCQGTGKLRLYWRVVGEAESGFEEADCKTCRGTGDVNPADFEYDSED